MAPTLRSVVRNFHEYGHRSSMHGLSHMYHAADTCRKVFWFVLTIAGTCACLFHIVMTVRNYLETPVTSILMDDSAKAEFPDVTLCNLKPMSESLSIYYEDVVHQHLEYRYGFFDRWWPNRRKRYRNESRVDYHKRLRDIFERYLQIFWVSDDSRDLGMMDKMMLLHCSFNGIPCGHKNFSLVQNYRYWNCYTFSPSPQYRFASSGHMEDTGLNLILYTDSNFHDSIYQQNATYKRKKQDAEEMTRPYSLREYITTGGRTFNQILSGGRYDIEGVRIWLHMRVDHPMLSNIYNDVQNGMSAMLDVDQTQYVTLNQPGERECQFGNLKTIEYITSFGSNSQGIRRRRYTRTDRESVVEAKQEFVFQKCGCYSHHFPFHVNTTQLCYFVAREHSIDPPEELIGRISCHDEMVLKAEENSYNFIQNYLHYKPCKYTKFVAYKASSTWPRSDESISFVNEYLIPNLHNGTEYLSHYDPHLHHIFNFSDPNVKAVIAKKPMLSHEQLALQGMLNQDCFENETLTGHTLDNMWCLDKEKMAYNVLRVMIKPTSPAAAKYEEKFSYEWPEALSEIGGIFGLWVGMSLLTFFEFIELLYLMATSRESRPSMVLCMEQELGPMQLEQLLSRLKEEEEADKAPPPEPPGDQAVTTDVEEKPPQSPQQAGENGPTAAIMAVVVDEPQQQQLGENA